VPTLNDLLTLSHCAFDAGNPTPPSKAAANTSKLTSAAAKLSRLQRLSHASGVNSAASVANWPRTHALIEKQAANAATASS